MTVLEALILGITQGLTEFLPVSSSGHLVLVPEFFNLSTPTVGFDIVVHVATLLAVLAYFMRDVRSIVLALFAPARMSGTEVKYWRRLFVWIVIGSVPAAVAGFGFARFFEGLFESTLAHKWPKGPAPTTAHRFGALFSDQVRMNRLSPLMTTARGSHRQAFCKYRFGGIL